MSEAVKSKPINGQASLEIKLQPVGMIQSKIKEPFLTANKDGLRLQKETKEAIVEYRRSRLKPSKLFIDEKWQELLDGIEEYSHLVVFYWAHKIETQQRLLKKVHPMGRKEWPEVGIFSTFSPARPNPVLMTVVNSRARRGNTLEVTGLDAVDGSPVLDIKPYVRDFYPQEENLIPDWMQRILEEFDESF